MSKGIVLSLCDYSGAWSRPFIALGYTVVRVDPMHDAGRMTTEGTTVHGSMVAALMPDGGYSLAATAGQLADYLAESCIEPGLLIASLVRSQLEPRDQRSLPAFGQRIVGVLSAPPCTHFSGSGARHWAGKDADGRTGEAIRIVLDCLHVVHLCKPDWHALENPVGRIARLVPEVGGMPDKFIFDPCDFATLADGDQLTEAYTKKTCLWGSFKSPKYLADRVEPVMFERTRKDGSKVRGSWMWANLGGKSERTKALRSKTPTGFARAFALAQESK
jgi:hypothetical protein